MNHTDIFLPVKNKVSHSIFLASIAQVLKLSIWLMLIWVLHQLMLDTSVFPGLPIVSLLVLSILFYTLRTYAHDKSHYAAFELEKILRTRLIKKINQLPIETVRNMGNGNLVKTLIDDIKELHAFVADAPPLKAEAFVTPIFTLLVLFIFNWVFASIVFAITLVTFLLLSFIMKKAKLLKESYNNATIQINSKIIEYIQGMSAVRTFDAGEGAFGQYQKALENYSQVVFHWLQSMRLSTKIARSLFSAMPMSIILVVGLSLAQLNDQISFITTFCFLLLAIGIAESVHPVMSLFQILQKSKAAIERIFEVENLPILEAPSTPLLPDNNEIIFKNVGFSYLNSDTVLSNINIKIPENSFTALIGTSGSGKTTLTNLIPRFLDATSGTITLGGVNIKEIEYAELMSRISFVFQDNFLFSCSIADNIRYGLDDISDEDVIEAAKKAEIHDFILTLPQQYNTLAGERGQLLSGGQKQRITIARVFLQNRPIVILDEPTAFSDARNEALLLKAFNRLIDKNKTVIMVTHRLSTIVNADQIILLDKGMIKIYGTHNDLIENSSDYKLLWQEYNKAKDWSIPVNNLADGEK
ncbi:ABC transporter ATP-binding protein [Gilliamella apis]|uniref:ABC transporter ATP-binding protein n=1 Tax=Gilliamella apis TaxID=1970738 RepID=UPI00080E5923|nr:ABC transporter ATP-binding protein [Gilliamella apis]OCG05846.1 ABC transporter permease [Gilliamella apis]